MKNLVEQYKKARHAATPLIAISTPDPSQTIKDIMVTMDPNTKVPMAKWDCIGGAIGLNERGSQALAEICSQGAVPIDPKDMVNPVDLLVFAERLTPKSVVFLMNGHRYFEDKEDTKQFIQALWNLRDVFKSKGCSIVLLGPSFSFPAELKQDIVLIDQPYPDDAALETIVRRVSTHNKVDLSTEQVNKTVDALRGLAAFPAEQVVAMSLEKKGIDQEMTWERKVQIIESNDGMSVWRGGAKFNDLGGLSAAKQFFSEYLAGKNPPRAIVFIDEIEKTAVANTGESSGTSSDQQGVMLTKMQDNGWTGSLLYGHAGTGKTQLAKILGNEAGVPTIYFDLGAAKGGIVGESEHKIRNNFKVVEAIAQDKALFIATCNDITKLKPELIRRFGLPTFFFDLLTDEERMAVKKIYCKQYGFDLKVFDDIQDKGWTGSEIERCCKLAYWLNTTPDRTAKYIVPIAQSSAHEIRARRKQADGNYLSASFEGVYRMDTNPMPVYTVGGEREIEFEN